MKHFVNRGNTIQLNWTLHSITGNEFSLNGHSYRLFFSTGNQSAIATGVTHSGNVLSWTFTPDGQWKLGSYTIWLEVYANGTKIVTVAYPDAFHLIHEVASDGTTQTGTQTESTTLNLVSSCDFYRFAPVVPVAGEDGYWYVNGEKAVDGSGEYILTSHTLEYDETTRNLIIDRGRVDSEGHSIEQVITALADLDSYYQAAEGSEDGSVAGDGSRWGSYKTAETARNTAAQNAETARQTAASNAEGTKNGSTAGDGSRWGEFKSAEAERETASENAIARANAAAEAAEHMVEIHQGPPGDDGDSAYEIAVQEGFVGTKAEWLASLDGSDGTGIDEVEQTETSIANGGTNKVRITLTDGTYYDIQIKNGSSSAGLFPTSSALAAACPSPKVGDYAFVGDGFPADIYVCATAGTWTDSGEDYDGDEVDLTDYAKKSELTQLEAETTDFKEVENRKMGKDVTYGEAKVTPTWTDGYQISKTDGSLLTSSSMAYTAIAIGAAKKIRFLGSKFKTPSSWNGGYAFYDANDVCLAAYAFDAADDNANGTKEYIVGVPSGAVTFKTSVYTGDSYPLATKDNFYCYLIDGATVSDLLEGITQINRSAVDLSSISVVYYYINSSGNWTNNGYHRSLTVPVFPGQRYRITANNDYPTVYAFLTSTAREGGSSAPLVAGTTIVTVPKMETVEVIIPATCFYINFRGCTSQAEYNISPRLRCPSSFVKFNELLSVVTELETKRANLLVPMVGNAQTIVYSPHIKSIVGGYGYRLHLLNPDVSMTGVSSNEYTLSVYFDAGDTIRLATSNNPFKETYDFLVPSGAKEMYLGIRCAKGATFDVMVEQLGENGGGDITALNPESEFVPKFMSAKKRYYTSSDTDEPTPLVLLHLSDIHGNWTNVERFIKFADKYTSYIDVLINTGDTVADKLDDGTSGYAEIDGVEKVLNVIGNHDSSKYEGGVRDWQYYCGLPCYEVFIAPFVSDWGVTQPENAAANGYCYYYKDFSAKKIRLVIVDIMSYDATQDAWLDSVLDDALSNGYHILIATHFAGSTAPGHGDDAAFTKVPCNYTSLYSLGGSSSLLNSYNANGYLMMATVQNFIDGGGHFAGYIQGHYHADFVAKVADYPDQMIYAIGSSRSGELRDYKHTVGTRMQDEFQIVSVDTKNTIVKLYKVGANYDRYGRSKGSVCVNYTTGEVLGEGF